MHAKTQFAIMAEAENKRLVHHNLVTSCALQIHVAHGDRDVTMNLDAVLGGVIIIPDFDPTPQRKTCVLQEVWIASDEVGDRTAPGPAKAVLP